MEQQVTLPIGDVEERKVTRIVNVKLQPHEKAAKYEQIGQHEKDLDLAEAEKSEAVESANDAKRKVAGIEAKIKDLRTQAKTGIESRQEECIERRLYQANVVQIIYDGEVVEERAMTHEERQRSLDDVKHGVVMAAEDDVIDVSFEEMDDEEKRADIAEVIREERSVNKTSLVDA